MKNIPIYQFETIPSTNQILWDYLDMGKIAPMVAIASQQTAGRGQWGRTWQSSLGGLYLSLMLPLNLPVTYAPHLTLLSGVGIAKSLQNYQIPVQLKWPNDLILNKHKLGGIKTETRLQKNSLTHAVIGVGINWCNNVPDIGITLKSYLEKQGLTAITTLEELINITIEGLLTAYQTYQEQGIDAILSDYWSLFAYRDRFISVAGNSAQIIGITAQSELTIRLMSSGAKTEMNLAPGTISLGYDLE